MILPNELRIGNLVQRRVMIDILDASKYALVNYIMIRDCEYYKDNWAFEGIPLTEDLLNKCPVKLEKFGYQTKWTSTGRLEITLGVSYINTVTYFHEYQNIFFALTSEELTFYP